MHRRTLLLSLWLPGAALTLTSTAPADDTLPPPAPVELSAGDHERYGAPIVFTLPQALQASKRLVLEGPDRAPSPVVHAVQPLGDGSGRAVIVLRWILPAGATRRAVLKPLPRDGARAPAVTCRQDDRGLVVSVQGRPVLQYNTAVVEPPEGIDPVFRRSGHIHPVWTPAGRIVTDEFPLDHPHQHGLFAAWVNTTFEGRNVDFWNQKGRTGNVEHVKVDDVVSGDVFGGFTVTLRHLDLTAPGAPKPVLQERWTVRVYDVSDKVKTPAGQPDGPSPDRCLFDIESVQTCIADAPLVLNEYHYGGMAFRGSGQWFRQPEHDFLTSEGRTRADGNHTRPNWVSAHGLVDGAPCGVTFFCHPENFRAPHPVRLHPDKPYFVFTPPVLGEFRIEPGAEYVSRYRVLVHDGKPDVDALERAWNDYATPPTVESVP
jgi:hypothetical protein